MLISIFKTRELSEISKAAKEGANIFFLSDDYENFLEISCITQGKAKNLRGLFNDVFEAEKEDLVEALSEINRLQNSELWWDGQIASRNPAATPFMNNIIYFLCAIKIIKCADRDVAFIVNNAILAQEIKSKYCKQHGMLVRTSFGIFDYLYLKLNRSWNKILQSGYFFLHCIKSRFAARRIFRRPSVKSIMHRLLMQVWVTKGSFDANGNFKNRNFGVLGDWLSSRGREVWILPMFFNIDLNYKKIYSCMAGSGKQFIVPDMFISLSDYVKVFLGSLKASYTRVNVFVYKGIDISPFINDGISRVGLNPSLMIINLSGPMLKRLNQYSYVFESFIYPFESNAPEKSFILACHRYYHDRPVIGFQHTTFFPNQLAYILGKEEKSFCPLPDKLVLSGPAYRDFFIRANYPENIIIMGSNLRFGDVYGRYSKEPEGNNILVLMPGLADCRLAFEILHKVKLAVDNIQDYHLYIRMHPVLPRQRIVRYMQDIGLSDYVFADGKRIQDWLCMMRLMITIGTSITTLEAAAFGVPVIRIIPDNSIHFDSLGWQKYPLQPVPDSEGIKKQLDFIMAQTDKNAFENIARDILRNYFTESGEDTMSVFIT